MATLLNWDHEAVPAEAFEVLDHLIDECAKRDIQAYYSDKIITFRHSNKVVVGLATASRCVPMNVRKLTKSKWSDTYYASNPTFKSLAREFNLALSRINKLS